MPRRPARGAVSRIGNIGASNTLVKTWLSPSPGPELSVCNAQLEKLSYLCDKAADDYGVERPAGYTVSFHYNAEVEQHHFGETHPMKPWRLTLTKQLVLAYGLSNAMDNYTTRKAFKHELARFHAPDYLDFLEKVSPANEHKYGKEKLLFEFAGDSNDCPVFDGIWDYVALYGGSSLDAARKLCSDQSDIAINWSGGLHHAKKGAASGFCYINDIVLAIQELLIYHQRVLYIDIDVHHGDGVQNAFWSTNRVFSLSYHKYDPVEFFPGTGGKEECGPESLDEPGAHYTLNVPLNDGIEDGQYRMLFETITGDVIDAYKPGAIVLQCGADSLGGDRLGRFNLNIKGHGNCVEFVKRKRIPLLVLGGGGYTPRNVARTWCHETAICVSVDLPDHLPNHIWYRQAFEGPERGDGMLYPELNVAGTRHPKRNLPGELNDLIANAKKHLRFLQGAPGIQMKKLPNASNQSRIQTEIDAEFKLWMEEKGKADEARKRKERNFGGRNEYRF